MRRRAADGLIPLLPERPEENVEEEGQKEAEEEDEKDKEKKKAAHEEDEDKEKKKQDDDKEEEDELEKEGEGEKKVKLPKVPAEETGGGEPAQGGEGEDVKFIEKNYVKKEEFDEIKKQMDNLTNKAASTPRPATGVMKAPDGKKPKDLRDITKMIQARNK